MKYLYIVLMILLILPITLAVTEAPISCRAELRVNKIDENNINLIIVGEDNDEFLNPNSFVYKIKYNSTVNNITNSSEGLHIFDGDNNLLPVRGTWINIIVSKQFGNTTDLFDIVETCNEMANFSAKWELCIKQRTDLELLIANELINKSDVDNLTTEVSSLQSQYNDCSITKTSEVKKLNDEINELTKNRNWGFLIGGAGIVLALYFLNKYRGFGKRKHQEETEFPRDVPS